MFAKLLKHEFKNNTKLFITLSLCAIGASILGSGLFYLFLNIIQAETDGIGAVLGGVTAILMWAVVLMSLVAYTVTISILLLFRFYKHLFSDEGYLTFTLPVTTHQILLSKILHIAIWSLISFVVILVSYLILLLPFFSLIQGITTPDFSIMMDIFTQELGAGYFASQIFYILSAAMYSLILPLLSITIGSLLAKKHKILTSFGIYFGLTAALSIIQSIMSILVIIGNSAMAQSTVTTYSVFTGIVPGVIYLGLAVGGYFIMHHLLDKKLNLT